MAKRLFGKIIGGRHPGSPMEVCFSFEVGRSMFNVRRSFQSFRLLRSPARGTARMGEGRPGGVNMKITKNRVRGVQGSRGPGFEGSRVRGWEGDFGKPFDKLRALSLPKGSAEPFIPSRNDEVVFRRGGDPAAQTGAGFDHRRRSLTLEVQGNLSLTQAAGGVAGPNKGGHGGPPLQGVPAPGMWV